MSNHSDHRLLACVISVSALLASCGPQGHYVWARELGEAQFTVRRTGDYVLEKGDVVSIRVVGQDSLTTRARVRPDGRVSLPLIGETTAERLTPAALAREVEARLKPFIVTPSVSVTVEETRETRVPVVGEVSHPGVYAVPADGSVLDAIANAGGPTEFAHKDRVFVIRPGKDGAARIRFAYDRLTRGEAPDADFALRPGDTVVVE